MNKQESGRENEMLKILLGFAIQTDHLMLIRRPNLVLINKKKEQVKWILLFR